MVTKELNGHRIVFYDDIEDLPVSQFHKYSRYLLLEGGIGDSIKDIDQHITKIINYLSDTKKAYQELLNLRKCMYLVATEQDLRYKAVLCLVKSLDGKEWEDFSDTGINALYDLVNKASVKELDTLIAEVSKRIDSELTLYFPKIFEDSVTKNYSDMLRKRAIMQIASIVNGEDKSKEIEELTRQMTAMQKVKSFEGKESEEVKFDKQFEEMCLVMAKEFGGGIKKFTTMEFYSAYERLVKEGEEQRKLNRRKKK